MSAAVTFAFGAGLLATVNPCGFAMLPSFLSLYLGTEADSERRRSLIGRASQGFSVGLVLSAAFGSVFILAGLIVTAGLRSFISVVPWIVLVIGTILLVLGLAMLAGRHVSFVPASRVGVRDQGTGFGRVAIFGASYAVASLSCTFAVFLIVVSQAVSVGNPVQVLAVFGSYAAGSATVLIALSLSAALAGGALAQLVRRSLKAVNRVSGALLALSGVYLIAYWLPSITSANGGTGASSSAARWTEHLSSTLTTFLQANTNVFAVVLAGFVAFGAALLIVNATRGTEAPSSSEMQR